MLGIDLREHEEFDISGWSFQSPKIVNKVVNFRSIESQAQRLVCMLYCLARFFKTHSFTHDTKRRRWMLSEHGFQIRAVGADSLCHRVM